MVVKPFKPLTINRAVDQSKPCALHREPPQKKRKLSAKSHAPDVQAPSQFAARAALPLKHEKTTFRSPLGPVKNSSQPTSSFSLPSEPARLFRAVWRKVTAKKHKTWDGDGTLFLRGGYATLKDEGGKSIGRIACTEDLEPGSTLSMSGKDVEIDSEILGGGEDDIDSLFLPSGGHSQPTMSGSSPEKARTKQEFAPPTTVIPRPKPAQTKVTATVNPYKQSTTTKQSAFKAPLTDQTIAPTINHRVPTPRHDPNAPDALVMKRPKKIMGKDVVDVVVDPLLCKHLREHQREGVKFLYNCVMGQGGFEGEGAILADEMGLGKSLQTIALIWTLIKQNPFFGEGPIVKKAIVVCPASLVGNWRKEFRKWLGRERIGVLVADEKMRINSFTRGKSYQVLIVGYERFVKLKEDLQRGEIDLVVADEGHRLKTAKNQALNAIKSLDTERRIVLSGTPLQNDLKEMYHVADLVNPGLLGKYTTYRKNFENPIADSRQQNATDKQKELGAERYEELKQITAPFILRRKIDILAKYLPPKTEHVLFCRPTKAQRDIYETIVSSPLINDRGMSFRLLSTLKKICNIPSLLVKDTEETKPGSVLDLLSDVLPSNKIQQANSSGKLRALDDLLQCIESTTNEKVVVISNYTETLDHIVTLLTSCDRSLLRLDGNTPQSKRTGLVDTFNNTSQLQNFVFLLSTKAGGQGLNLIGASRLILFDSDWNPALDVQAMARICRDGQKNPCHIYRLMTKGTLDEKIFQRQVTKMGLAESMVDGGKTSGNAFSQEELRDLYTFDSRETCQTHDLLGCDCLQDGALRSVEASPEATGNQETDVEDLPEVEDLSKESCSFMPASQYQPGEDGLVTAADKMQGLMLYAHLDARAYRQRMAAVDAQLDSGTTDGADQDSNDDGATNSDAESPPTKSQSHKQSSGVDDKVLRAVLLQDSSAVDYVLSLTNKTPSKDAVSGGDEE